MSAEFPAMLTRNLREHVDAICAGRDPRRRAKLFLKKYGNLLDDLCALPELQRLKKLRQYGVKMYAGQSSLVAFDGQMISVSRQRLIHTRYQHSLLVCAHMIALGSHLQIDYDELAIAACGALLHDIGHTPFSHDGDLALMRIGYESHEARSRRLVFQPGAISSLLERYSVQPGAVVDVIREDGYLGQMQKLVDTLAYCILDTSCLGALVDESFSKEVIASTLGFEHGLVVARNTAPFRRLMELRTFLGEHAILHHEARLNAAAVDGLLCYVLQNKIISASVIANSTDAEMRKILEEYCLNGTLPEWSHTLFRAIYGDHSGLHAYWAVRYFDSEAAYGKVAECVNGSPVPIARNWQHDFFSKRYFVQIGSTAVEIEPRTHKVDPRCNMMIALIPHT